MKWHLAPILKLSKPTHIDIELNTNCNQKCISCWHNQPKNLPFRQNALTINQVRQYLIDGRKLKANSVKFNLRGEPTLSPILTQSIFYAKHYGYADIMINTNGATDINIDELFNAGLTTLIISVDSFIEHTYKKMHGATRKQYHSVLDLLLYINKQINKGLYHDKNIVLNFHVNELNHKEMHKYERFFNGMRQRGIKIVIRYTENREGKHISIAKDRKRKNVCPHMYRRLTITANGNIYPCCVCYTEPQDILLSDKDLIDANNNGKLKALKQDYEQGIFTESCLNCTSGDIYE